MDLVRVVALREEALRHLKFSFAFERLPSSYDTPPKNLMFH